MDFKKIDLYGVPVFETAILNQEMTMPQVMHNEACYIYVKQGKMHAFEPSRSELMETKESVLMKCGSYFGKAIPDPSSGQYQGVGVHFHPKILKSIFEEGLPEPLQKVIDNPERAGLARIKRNELFERYIDSILFYFENPSLVNDEILVLKLKELLLLLANTRDAPFVAQILSDLFSPYEVKFKEVIEAHLYSQLTIDQLAVLTNNSLSSFKREFKKLYDDSPANYIRNRKLDKANSLLKASDESISNIAYDCGFSDISHFSKVFKSKFGQAPSEAR